MVNFVKIARQLNELLQTRAEGESCKLSEARHGARKSRESIQEQMTSQCEEAFQHLKRSLTEVPVLAYADPGPSHLTFI